jgi:alkylation response protein AidB-like acyl-CoA dehydrogenase
VASVNRLVKSEFEQHMQALALRAAGPYAALGSRAPNAVDNGRWTFGYLMSRATTIGAGTAEIQRNTIAESVLGLPSHRGEGTRAAAVTPGAPLAAPEEDERELREVLAATLKAKVDEEALLDRKRPIDAAEPEVWSALTDFGLPGLAVDESLGGAGARPRLLYAAIEEAAKALAPAPLVPTVTALDVALQCGAKALVQRITAGAAAAFAVPVDDSGWMISGPELPEWDGARLSGVVAIVAGAPNAEALVVLARIGGGGEVLVTVDASADGVDVTAHQPLDVSATIGSVTLTAAEGEVIADGNDVARALGTARRQAVLAVAADSVGVASRALAMAVQWAGERHQFGRAIGSFQAVSHRCADMLVALEGARSQVFAAAEADLEESGYLADLAAAAALDAGVVATEGALQIHGGIGFTWEHPIHLLLRRAQANAVLVGRADALRDRAAGDLLALSR